MSGQQQNQGQFASENDTSVGLMFAVGGFFLYILFLILIKYLAFISPYFFYPFTMPVYAFAGSGFTAAIIVMIYALIAFAIAFLPKIAGKKIRWGAVTYGVFWLLVAAGELLFFKTNELGQSTSPLTSHVSKFCNPSDNGLLYIMSCQNTMDDMQGFGTLAIILAALVPNMVYGLSAITNTFGNYGSLMKHPKSIAKRRIADVDALINAVAPHQPHLLIYKDIDPNRIDYNSGQLRLMDTPRRFCFENNLVSGFTKRPSKYNPSSYKKFNDPDAIDKNLKFTVADENDYVPRLDIDKFEEVMMQSLGEVFTTIDALTPTQTVVLGIALSLTCRADLNMSDDDAKKILKSTERQCDEIFKWAHIDLKTAHKVNLGFAAYPHLEQFREAIAEWRDHHIAKEVFNNHAYINTIILRCLTDAKKLGVFQPSTLRWLLFYDRPLFAVVQNESRPSVFAENAATSSHYYVELKAGKKIYEPKLQIAYDGIMDNLREYKYSKKRVSAWEHYKNTGDAQQMITEKMVSEDFKYGN